MAGFFSFGAGYPAYVVVLLVGGSSSVVFPELGVVEGGGNKVGDVVDAARHSAGVEFVFHGAYYKAIAYWQL